MKGYWQNQEATASTITPDGWLRTGDAGYRDADGFVFIHDRVKDMVVSGGENIYPAEVENVLFAHPGVADAAVIGVPSEKWGETVKAVIVRTAGPQGDEVTAEMLIEMCRSHLAHFKCPTSVDFVDALPRNPSGKVLKRELREPYWKGVERRIG
jgi:long-chain acyl-CoA synthetase